MQRAWLAIGLVVFLEGFVLWTVLPTLHRFVLQLNGGPITIGLLFGAMSLPKLISNPVFGRLSDRIGRKPVLIISGIGNIIASLLWAFAGSLSILALSRIVAGVSAVQAALAQSVVADLTTPDRRAAGMGIIGAAFGLSMIISPITGAEIAERYGVANIGWWSAAAQTLSLAVVIFLMPETLKANKSQEVEQNVETPKQAPLLSLPGVALLLTAIGVSMAANGQLTSSLGIVLEQTFQWRQREIGYAIASLGIVGVIVQGGLLRVLLKHLRTQQVALIGCATLALGGGLLAAANGSVMIWAGLATFGVGLSLVQPTTSGMLSNRILPEHQGRIMGMHQGVTAAGRGLGAGMAGMLLSISFRTPYMMAAALSLLVAALLYFVPEAETRKPKLPQDDVAAD